MTDGEHAALRRALGTYADRYHKSTWAEIKEQNISDKELMQILSDLWSAGGGSAGPGWTPIYQIGSGKPRVYFHYGPRDQPDLHGAELITQVRIVLDMPRPPEDGQLSLF